MASGAPRRSARRRGLGLLFGIAATASCTTPVERLADEQGLESAIRAGEGYRHLVLTRPVPGPVPRLHVYIEGDGSPWQGGRVPAADPTPRRAYALELMALDARPSAYVGRPCYFGLARLDECSTDDWTSDRYSVRVVTSMARVIGDLGEETGSEELVLIGYSGGGVLARLVAARLPNARAVVTVAANLDTDAWIDVHGYLPLTGSVNPAAAEPLPAGVRHLQIVGGDDTVVPPSVTEGYRRSGQRVEVWTYEGFDHRCCWVEAWPAILARVEGWLAAGDGDMGMGTG